MLCRAAPSVWEAAGDISATALPCRAMLSVAATSHRQCQVTRRIQRLQAMDARVMVMRAVRATRIRRQVVLERGRVLARPPFCKFRRLCGLQSAVARAMRHRDAATNLLGQCGDL